MVQAGSKAVIRKAAPAFEGMAWWNNKFQAINLEQFRGKNSIISCIIEANIFLSPRQVRRPLFLAPGLHLRLPDRNLPVLRQSCGVRGHRCPSHWLLHRLSLHAQRVHHEAQRARRSWPHENPHAFRPYQEHLT